MERFEQVARIVEACTRYSGVGFKCGKMSISEGLARRGRGLDAGDDRVAVSRPRLVHDPRSGRAQHGRRTVATAIVDDHDFAGCLPAFQQPRRLAHAMRYRLILYRDRR